MMDTHSGFDWYLKKDNNRCLCLRDTSCRTDNGPWYATVILEETTIALFPSGSWQQQQQRTKFLLQMQSNYQLPVNDSQRCPILVLFVCQTDISVGWVSCSFAGLFGFEICGVVLATESNWECILSLPVQSLQACFLLVCCLGGGKKETNHVMNLIANCTVVPSKAGFCSHSFALAENAGDVRQRRIRNVRMNYPSFIDIRWFSVGRNR